MLFSRSELPESLLSQSEPVAVPPGRDVAHAAAEERHVAVAVHAVAAPGGR